jgi:epoxide hydrolase-like predicted phosphatase
MAEANGKALLVDFGGVLTTDIWSSFSAFCQSRGLDPEAAKNLFRENPEALEELRKLERGEADPQDFERRFAKLLGTEPEGLVEGLFSGLGPADDMLTAVRRAREGGAPTGLVSNSWVMDHYTDDLRDLFDAVVISGEVGMHKPEPEIFELAARRVNRDPSDCVFVDDLRENCTGAEALGMTAILHRDPAATIERLEDLLGLKLA